jgi:cytochrome c oxidase subunit 1
MAARSRFPPHPGAGLHREFLIGGVWHLPSAQASIYFHDTYLRGRPPSTTVLPDRDHFTIAGITFGPEGILASCARPEQGALLGTIIPFSRIFIPLFILGAAGEHRRIFDYSSFPWPRQAAGGADPTTLSLLVMLVSVIFYQFLRDEAIRGRRAEENPWKSGTLGGPPIPAAARRWADPGTYRGPYSIMPGRAEDY